MPTGHCNQNCVRPQLGCLEPCSAHIWQFDIPPWYGYQGCDVHTRLVCHLCSKAYLQHQPVESGHYQDQLIEVNELTLTAWQKTDLWLWLVNITDSRYGNNQTQLACFPCALVLLVSFSLSCPASIDLVKLVGGRPCNTADLCLEPSDLQTPPLTSLPLRTFHYFQCQQGDFAISYQLYFIISQTSTVPVI